MLKLAGHVRFSPGSAVGGEWRRVKADCYLTPGGASGSPGYVLSAAVQLGPLSWVRGFASVLSGVGTSQWKLCRWVLEGEGGCWLERAGAGWRGRVLCRLGAVQVWVQEAGEGGHCGGRKRRLVVVWCCVCAGAGGACAHEAVWAGAAAGEDQRAVERCLGREGGPARPACAAQSRGGA